MTVWDYPPYPYLEVVVTHCPMAARLYLDLWIERDDYCRILVKEEEFPTRFLMKKSAFIGKLLQLVREGVISYEENADAIIIEMVEWNDEVIEKLIADAEDDTDENLP